MFGLALVAVWAFSALAAGSASAFSLWDQCTKEASVLEFSNSDCTEKVGTSTFGWLEITAPLAVDSLPTTLTLKSNGTTIDCTGTMDGTVGGGAADEVTSLLNPAGEEITLAKMVKCPILASGLCGSGEAEATPVNLPWKTELVATGDLLAPHSGGGNPGWFIKCPSGVTNECKREDTILAVANLESELEVDLTFNPAEKATCSIGTGEVEGTVSILLVNGNALRAM
ncbi:MAG: hypothetical protein WB998_05355 [Solirubrobacteraceae bacterium]